MVVALACLESSSEAMIDFIHPVTGESLETQADFQRALGDLSEQLAPLYRVRRLIEEARAERFEPVLPERRARTQTQDRVARCPRCGARPHLITIESEEAP